MPGIKSNYIHTYTIMVELLPKGKCELDKKYIYTYMCMFVCSAPNSVKAILCCFLTFLPYV